MSSSNIKRCCLEQVETLRNLAIETLRNLAIETYYETFSDSNSEALLQKYFNESLSIEKLSAQLQDPNSEFHFIYTTTDTQQATPAGFLKLNIDNAQTDLMDPSALEVEKIYLLKAFLSQGLGKQMIRFSIERAAQHAKQYLWLGVWESNFPALAFYKKMGFEQFGSHDFNMGGDIQTDLMLKKTL